MRIRVTQFIEFAYGDQRKDKANVKSIVDPDDGDYEPAKDRYKTFREAIASFENNRISIEEFLELHSKVAANKSAGYKALSQNYVGLKEDYGLIWEGRTNIEAEISGLRIATAWYLRTEANNRKMIIYLNLRKEPLARKAERGLLTILQLAKPDSAGVGILNIQPGTLITATRLDQVEADFLRKRAAKFINVASDLGTAT